MIYADNPTQGAIQFSNEPGAWGVGNSFIVATNIKTISNANPSNLAFFTNKPYGLTLNILDDASAKVGTMTFTGVLAGGISSKSAIIFNSFTGPQTQSLQLGNHLYTVQIGPFASPGPPTSNPSGGISALVNVSTRDMGVPNAPPGMNTPEPSTLVLSGLCLALFGAGWWWKRTRALLKPGSGC
jgi:hypothetical protein